MLHRGRAVWRNAPAFAGARVGWVFVLLRRQERRVSGGVVRTSGFLRAQEPGGAGQAAKGARRVRMRSRTVAPDRSGTNGWPVIVSYAST